MLLGSAISDWTAYTLQSKINNPCGFTRSQKQTWGFSHMPAAALQGHTDCFETKQANGQH